MNHNKIGERIRKIRKKVLKQSIEEFAEELNVSKDTISRLENATSKVTNIEVFLKISEISGYTLDELLFDNKETPEKERIIRRINYILNILSKDELEYICGSLNLFARFEHRNQVKTLKDIKDEIKK